MSRKETVLIVGSSGYLGRYLQSGLTEFHIITASSSHPSADIKINEDGTLQFQREIQRIDVVIFCTALTKIKDCENNSQLAFYINCELPLRVHNELCKNFSYFSVIISSDAVFYADTSIALTELTMPNPLSVYGKTKRALEEAFSLHARGAVIRLPKLWRGERGDFVEKLSHQLTSQQVVYAIDDQYFCPLYIDDAIALIEKIAQRKQPGLYHLPGPELLSWHMIIMRLAHALNSGAKIERKSLNTTHSPSIHSSWSNLVTYHQFINEFNKKNLLLKKT